MTDPQKRDAQQAEALDESVVSGRITPAEADTIKSFFASRPERPWPATQLQKRMQSSGG